MALADWTDLWGGDKFELSIDHVYAGAKALRLERVNYVEASKVLTASITDSPTIANVESYAYLTSIHSAFGFHFRATDSSNYYVAWFDILDDTQITFWLSKRVGGSLSSTGWGQIAGNYLNDWFLFKVMFCEIGNTIYAEAYIDGTLKRQETDTSPSLAGGGAVGVAIPRVAGTTGYVWLDNTKIYY